jgi:hypothetical protein
MYSDRVLIAKSQNHMIANRLLATATCTGLLCLASIIHSLPSDAKKPVKSNSYPTIGKVLTLINGDLMCYVDVIDARGKKYNLGAYFEICQQSQFLNKRVQLTYKRGNVNDCQSAEPCGKTRVENLIVKMKLIRK